MKLTKDTKNAIKAGYMLRFKYGDAYEVETVIEYRNGGIAYTLVDQSGRRLYAFPASQCYGAEIVEVITEETEA